MQGETNDITTKGGSLRENRPAQVRDAGRTPRSRRHSELIRNGAMKGEGAEVDPWEVSARRRKVAKRPSTTPYGRVPDWGSSGFHGAASMPLDRDACSVAWRIARSTGQQPARERDDQLPRAGGHSKP